jgi:hypothetical protein
MAETTTSPPIDAPVATVHQAAPFKDRRRPGRIQNVSPVLIPLLRNPTAGFVAGDLAPVDKFQIVAAWAASAYPANVWLSMSATERSEAIDREMRDLDAAHAQRNTTGQPR